VLIELTLDNDTDTVVTVTRANLITRNGPFDGRFPAGGDEWRSARPHSERNVAIRWTLAERVVDALGDQPRLELELAIADKREELTIVFEKQ
jgi:hypothetical protein